MRIEHAAQCPLVIAPYAGSVADEGNEMQASNLQTHMVDNKLPTMLSRIGKPIRLRYIGALEPIHLSLGLMMLQKLKRRMSSILLIVLAVISVFLMLKSSGDPIINSLESAVFRNALLPFGAGNNIIFNIAVGYLVSSIFYFIVVFLPDRRRRKDVEPYINSKVEEVIFSLYALNSNIVRAAGKDYCFKTLTKEQLMDACSLVNPKEHKAFFHNGPKSVFEHHFGYKCFNSWSRIISSIEEIFRFLPYLDTGLVFHLNKIRSSNLSLLVSNLKDCEAFANTNMEVYAEEFYNVYVLTKLLRDYYIAEHKKEFRNDQWK